jgi:RNA recognition motif-containing protein
MLKKEDKIKRSVPFSMKGINQKDIDQRMIYVENIPKKLSHQHLAQIFSRVGEILHVSVPKKRDSMFNKGYAFIEFKVINVFLTF